MKELKKHPFFEDIDFEKVSSHDFVGARDLVLQLFNKIKQEKILKQKAEEMANAKEKEMRNMLKGEENKHLTPEQIQPK